MTETPAAEANQPNDPTDYEAIVTAFKAGNDGLKDQALELARQIPNQEAAKARPWRRGSLPRERR